MGDDVFVGAGCWLHVLDAAPSGTIAISIGDGTNIVGDCVLSAAVSITLGRRVLIARNAYIADHMHAFDDHDRAVLDQGVTRLGPIRSTTVPGSARMSSSGRASGSAREQ